MGRPAAGAGVPAEPKPGTWQHSELKASAEEHGQFVLRPAAGLPHVCVASFIIPVLSICILMVICWFFRYVSPLTTSYAGTHRTLRSIGGGVLSLDVIRSWLCSKWLRSVEKSWSFFVGQLPSEREDLQMLPLGRGSTCQPNAASDKCRRDAGACRQSLLLSTLHILSGIFLT